jgi:hypothetical protein
MRRVLSTCSAVQMNFSSSSALGSSRPSLPSTSSIFSPASSSSYPSASFSQLSSSLVASSASSSVTDKIFSVFSLFLYSSHHHLKKYSLTHNPENSRKDLTIQSSQSYRHIINSYLENLVHDDLSKICNESELDQLDVIIDVMNDLNKLWLATEILLLASSETIAADVVSWLQVYLPPERPLTLFFFDNFYSPFLTIWIFWTSATLQNPSTPL